MDTPLRRELCEVFSTLRTDGHEIASPFSYHRQIISSLPGPLETMEMRTPISLSISST